MDKFMHEEFDSVTDSYPNWRKYMHRCGHQTKYRLTINSGDDTLSDECVLNEHSCSYDSSDDDGATDVMWRLRN
jgi:hypothetical protein